MPAPWAFEEAIYFICRNMHLPTQARGPYSCMHIWLQVRLTSIWNETWLICCCHKCWCQTMKQQCRTEFKNGCTSAYCGPDHSLKSFTFVQKLLQCPIQKQKIQVGPCIHGSSNCGFRIPLVLIRFTFGFCSHPASMSCFTVLLYWTEHAGNQPPY